MEKLQPVSVDVDQVRPLKFGEVYESRMILDHVVSGRDNVVQVNHGTVKAGAALGGAVHEDDEIYYILSGHGTLKLDDQVIPVHPDQVVFIPAGCFHALSNEGGEQDLCLLTMWRDYRSNDAYAERMRRWGKSFVTVDDPCVEDAE